MLQTIFWYRLLLLPRNLWVFWLRSECLRLLAVCMRTCFWWFSSQIWFLFLFLHCQLVLYILDAFLQFSWCFFKVLIRSSFCFSSDFRTVSWIQRTYWLVLDKSLTIIFEIENCFIWVRSISVFCHLILIIFNRVPQELPWRYRLEIGVLFESWVRSRSSCKAQIYTSLFRWIIFKITWKGSRFMDFFLVYQRASFLFKRVKKATMRFIFEALNNLLRFFCAFHRFMLFFGPIPLRKG